MYPPCPFPAIVFIPVRFTGMAARSGRPGRTRHLYTRPRWRGSISFVSSRPPPVLFQRPFLTIADVPRSHSLSLSFPRAPIATHLPSRVSFPPATTPFARVCTIAAHFDPCISVCLVPADLHTFFRGQLSVIRRSTWIDGEESGTIARANARPAASARRPRGEERGTARRGAEGRAGRASRGWFRGPGNAFNKDR